MCSSETFRGNDGLGPFEIISRTYPFLFCVYKISASSSVPQLGVLAPSLSLVRSLSKSKQTKMKGVELGGLMEALLSNRQLCLEELNGHRFIEAKHVKKLIKKCQLFFSVHLCSSLCSLQVALAKEKNIPGAWWLEKRCTLKRKKLTNGLVFFQMVDIFRNLVRRREICYVY